MKKLLSICLPALLFLSLLACNNTGVTPREKLSEQAFVYYTLKDVYLWNEELPELDYNSYPSAEAVLEAMRNRSYDRWSYIVRRSGDGSALPGNMKYDEAYGYGFDVIWRDSSLMISYVKAGSPAEVAGLRRGNKILKVNSTSIPDTPTGEFKSSIYSKLFSPAALELTIEGAVNPFSLSKGVYKKQDILISKVIPHAGRQVGYLMFNSFTSTGDRTDRDTKNDNKGLDDAFSSFARAGVTELVLDLRYNGGGSVAVSSYLANLIAGALCDGSLYKTLYFNRRSYTTSNIDVRLAYLDFMYRNSKHYRIDYLPELGRSVYYFNRLDNSLNLKRIFVITTGDSASASESLINGLKPHIDLKLIGSRTHGKPVGMIPLTYKDIQLVAIMFRGENSLGQGDFYRGLPVDKEAADDLTNELGSVNETSLKEALYYIEHDSFSGGM